MQPYIIVTATNQEALAECVCLRMQQGYTPQGGVFFVDHPAGGSFWTQAMIKKAWLPKQAL